MTTIKFLKENGEIVGFIASGHANAAKFGRDIVCASISTATQLIAVGFGNRIGVKSENTINYDKDGYLKVDYSYENYKGLNLEKAKLLMHTLYEFVTVLKQNYDEFIEVLEDEKSIEQSN